MLNGAVESWGWTDNDHPAALRPAICHLHQVANPLKIAQMVEKKHLEMRAMAIAVFPNQAREARYLTKQKCHQCVGLTLVFDNLGPRASKLCTGKLFTHDGHDG